MKKAVNEINFKFRFLHFCFDLMLFYCLYHSWHHTWCIVNYVVLTDAYQKIIIKNLLCACIADPAPLSPQFPKDQVPRLIIWIPKPVTPSLNVSTGETTLRALLGILSQLGNYRNYKILLALTRSYYLSVRNYKLRLTNWIPIWEFSMKVELN